jgi:adenine-specific DNA-methyltransferase
VRDKKKYNAPFANQWIINTHNGIREKKILPVDVKKDYPAVYDHLSKYEDALSNMNTKRLHVHFCCKYGHIKACI